MQCCPAGAWGSGPWNAGAGEQTQPRSGSLKVPCSSETHRTLASWVTHELLLHLGLARRQRNSLGSEKVIAQLVQGLYLPVSLGWWGMLTEPLLQGYLLLGHFHHAASLSFVSSSSFLSYQSLFADG